MQTTSGLAKFRGVVGMNSCLPRSRSTYDTDTQSWSNYGNHEAYSEQLTAYVTSWYVNVFGLQARVVFTWNGNICFYFETAHSFKRTSNNSTQYEGFVGEIEANLPFNASPYYHVSTRLIDRHFVQYEDVVDDYVTVRYNIYSGSQSKPYYVEITVYKDGTVLHNCSDNTPFHTVRAFKYKSLGADDWDAKDEAVSTSGRRSFVILPVTYISGYSDNTYTLGWQFVNGDRNTTLIDLRYIPTLSLTQTIVGDISPYPVNPNYYALNDLNETVGSNETKLFIRVNGETKFIKATKNLVYGSQMVKFKKGNDVYVLDPNLEGGIEFAVDVVQQSNRRVSRVYTSSNKWWNNGVVYGFPDGVTIRKAIVCYDVSHNTLDKDYTQYLPNYTYPRVHFLYRHSEVNLGKDTYVGYGQSYWSSEAINIPNFSSSNLYGSSGSLVFDFTSSPITAYEITVAPHSPGDGYYNGLITLQVILITNNI